MERLDYELNKKKDDIELTIKITPEDHTYIKLGLRELKNYYEEAIYLFKDSHSEPKTMIESLKKVNRLIELLK
jgi:hypothetical protein